MKILSLRNKLSDETGLLMFNICTAKDGDKSVFLMYTTLFIIRFTVWLICEIILDIS